MSECCRLPKLAPREQAMVAQFIANNPKIAACAQGQILIDFGLAELSMRITEVLPKVRV